MTDAEKAANPVLGENQTKADMKGFQKDGTVYINAAKMDGTAKDVLGTLADELSHVTDSKNGKTFNQQRQDISTAYQQDENRQFAAYNGPQTAPTDTQTFTNAMAKQDFSQANAAAGSVQDPEPRLTVKILGETLTTDKLFKGEDKKVDIDQMASDGVAAVKTGVKKGLESIAKAPPNDGGTLLGSPEAISYMQETGREVGDSRELAIAGNQVALGNYAAEKNNLGTLLQMGSYVVPVVGETAMVRDGSEPLVNWNTSSTTDKVLGVATVFVGGVSAVGRMAGEVSAVVNTEKVAGGADFYVKPDGTAIPGTGYRAIVGDAAAQAAKNENNIMSPSNAGTYITFDDISKMPKSEIKSALQITNEPSYVAKFDTLQIIDDIQVPNSKWGRGVDLEPITNSYPNLGSGGATQAVTKTPISNYILIGK